MRHNKFQEQYKISVRFAKIGVICGRNMVFYPLYNAVIVMGIQKLIDNIFHSTPVGIGIDTITCTEISYCGYTVIIQNIACYLLLMVFEIKQQTVGKKSAFMLNLLFCAVGIYDSLLNYSEIALFIGTFIIRSVLACSFGCISCELFLTLIIYRVIILIVIISCVCIILIAQFRLNFRCVIGNFFCTAVKPSSVNIYDKFTRLI